MRIAVRRVNEWDAPSMLKLLEAYSGTPALEYESAPSLSEYVSMIDKYTYGMGWIMCEIDSETAGFCYLTESRSFPDDPFKAEIRFFVKEEFKRRGVGTALCSLMLGMMQISNRREALAIIHDTAREARGFFTAMGFYPDVSLSSGKADFIVMRKALSPADPLASRPTKPYLIENSDYEFLREQAACFVKET